MRFLGDPGYQTGVAEDIGVSRSTVTKTTRFVLGKVVEKSKELVVFPTGRKTEEAKVEWSSRFTFPIAFAAIDCTHIPIVKPAAYGDDYVNRRGFVVLMAKVPVIQESYLQALMHSGLVLTTTAEFYETHQFIWKGTEGLLMLSSLVILVMEYYHGL